MSAGRDLNLEEAGDLARRAFELLLSKYTGSMRARGTALAVEQV